MDPRQNLARTSSSHVPQATYSPVNNMSASYQMPPYQGGQPHLPPINYQPPPMNQQGYMPQPPYRTELPRYPSSSAPAPTSTPDRYQQPHMAQNPMQGLPAPMLPQPQSQAPPQPGYPAQQATRQNYQQPLAPAPPRPDPMAPNYGHDNRQPAWTGAEVMPGMPADAGRDMTRTHVVGSQGRRGILPSAPGRPPVAPNGLNGSPKGGQLPQKDADGKFPCPNCTKTYLHAKHLKRHMLRHTGDRPYMCVLCNDTFSRSDILKRHFQKCSVRRGNPTGASHLSNPAAHLKKSQAAAQKAAQNAAAAGGTNSPASASTPVSAGPYTTTSMPGNSIPTTAGAPPPSSMAYSMNNAQSDISRPSSNQPMQSGHGQSGMDPNANQWAMHGPRNPQMMYHGNQNASDHYDDKRSAMPDAHQMGDEWNQMFPAGTNEQYMNPMFSGYGQSQNDVKTEHHEGGSNGYYIPPTSLGADGTPGPPLWNLNNSQEDPIQLKADRLVDFCFPAGIQVSLQEQQNNFPLRTCLSVDHIKHFLNLYSNFQGHFPWLHIPTFNIFEAYDGLFLTMLCSGAVYSDRVSQDQVRALIHVVKNGIDRTATVLRHLHGPLPHFSTSGMEHDELLSMHMLSNLLVWHGGPSERQAAFDLTGATQSLARRYGLMKLAEPHDNKAYSYLHNLTPGEQADPNRFKWQTYIEQEKRLRLMYLIFSFDAALTMYWNYREPSFSASEITLPMPCDDAVWEAADAGTCAQALGLGGPTAQIRVNVSGSLRPKSIECHNAMQALQNPSVTLQPRSTNVYSKFILIHALHAEIWQLQRQRARTSSPRSPHRADRHAYDQHAAQLQKSITVALTKWKQCWDDDMALQYGPGEGGPPARRVGFCRDGVQFYWLAKAFLQPNRMHDWQLQPEQKFRLVMKGLGQAREWSISDGARRGEEPGSVALIDDDYAPSEVLVLDMRKLMKPLGDHR